MHPLGSCGTLYESGEDKVYRYVASGPECISITLSQASDNLIGYQVYSGCPGSAGTTCIGNNSGALSGTLNGSVDFAGWQAHILSLLIHGHRQPVSRMISVFNLLVQEQQMICHAMQPRFLLVFI
jgi:hypothetical protein